jgi:hypothetical protein
MDFETHLCCRDPYGKVGHALFEREVYSVQPWMVQRCSSITAGQKICSTYRRELFETECTSATGSQQQHDNTQAKYFPKHSGGASDKGGILKIMWGYVVQLNVSSFVVSLW